jgi:arginine/serine-rich splicing factor 1/9
MSRSSGCRVYVGNLPPDVRESEIERIFDRYGRIRDINIKAPRDMGRGPNTSFAFVEFEDPRDAEDAVHEEDGQNFDRMRLRVEIAGGRGARDSGRGGMDRGGRGQPPPGRSKYGVKVENLTERASWQDLKDHMRKAGDIGFADVFGDRSGVVDFHRKDDMEFAIKDLDDSDFKDRFGETSRITVRRNEALGGSRSRSRSRSRSGGGRGRSRSKSRSRSRDRSKSRSKSKSRSRSRSRSRDRKD